MNFFVNTEHVKEPPQTFYLKQRGNRIIEDAGRQMLHNGDVYGFNVLRVVKSVSPK